MAIFVEDAAQEDAVRFLDIKIGHGAQAVYLRISARGANGAFLPLGAVDPLALTLEAWGVDGEPRTLQEQRMVLCAASDEEAADPSRAKPVLWSMVSAASGDSSAARSHAFLRDTVQFVGAARAITPAAGAPGGSRRAEPPGSQTAESRSIHSPDDKA